MKFKTTLLLVFFAQLIFPTEERNPYPFFRLSSKKMEIILESFNVSICLINTEDIFDYTLASREVCENIKDNVWNSIKKIIKQKPKKKEFIFQFFDKSNSKVKVTFSDQKSNYDFISIIYYRQEKVFYLELFDSEKNYYFFQVNPKLIQYKLKM